MCARGRHASHPSRLRGRRRGRRCPPAPRPDGVVGEDHALGLAGRAAGRHHQGVAVLDRVAGPQAPQDPLAGRGREAGVDGQHRVAPVPRPPEAVDEPVVGPTATSRGTGGSVRDRTSEALGVIA